MLQSMPSQSGSWLSDWRTATSPLKEFVFYIGKTCRYCKNFSRLATWPDCFKRTKYNYCIENIFRFAKDRAGRLREYCSRGMILLICQNTEYICRCRSEHIPRKFAMDRLRGEYKQFSLRNISVMHKTFYICMSGHTFFC